MQNRHCKYNQRMLTGTTCTTRARGTALPVSEAGTRGARTRCVLNEGTRERMHAFWAAAGGVSTQCRPHFLDSPSSKESLCTPAVAAPTLSRHITELLAQARKQSLPTADLVRCLAYLLCAVPGTLCAAPIDSFFVCTSPQARSLALCAQV